MGKYLAVPLIIAGAWFFVTSGQILASMSGTNYQIQWDAFSTGGSDGATCVGCDYVLYDTAGGSGDGRSDGSTYGLRAGYEQPGTDTAVINTELFTQDNATEVAYTSFSNALKQVEVADASGISIGNLIGVVENAGAGQLTAYGEVISKSVNLLTVDKWSGDNASMSGTPAGSNDFTYVLSSTADVVLGFASATMVNTSVSVLQTSTNELSGYTCTINENHNLQNSYGSDLNDVSDGAVSTGIEEYGIEKNGDDVVGSGTDTAILVTDEEVSSASSQANSSRTGITYKASIFEWLTSAGTYDQTLTYTCNTNI
ncbi:MAG: hypothetical protein ACD_76C00071G0003 [uncultured bacterium]|nr:MAG: hypothetical protein ACD_76C00071G0003 [uncultured bacterium]